MNVNLYAFFSALLPGSPLDVGKVVQVNADGVTVELPTGATLRVRGEAAVGETVYIQQGQITGPAPALSGVDLEV